MIRKLIPILVVISACTTTKSVSRQNWGALNNVTGNVTVRMKDGGRYQLSSFSFTESGLNVLSGKSEPARGAKSQITGPFSIRYDSIDVVQLKRGNSQKTVAAVGLAVSAAYFILASTIDNTRPEPVPRPVSTSCPFIYSYDGKSWRLDSETYSGAVALGLERTDVDNLDHIAAVDGMYRLALTNEVSETEYTDQLALVVTEHPIGTRVFPDASGKLHVVSTGTKPLTWRQHDQVSAPARTSWDATFARPKGDHLALVLRVRNTEAVPFIHSHLMNLLGEDVYSWYREVNTNPAAAKKTLDWYTRMAGLAVSTGNRDKWQQNDIVPIVGPVVAKTIVVPIDASTDDDVIRVRLQSSPMLWKIESAEIVTESESIAVHDVELARAIDQNGEDVTQRLRAIDGGYHVALNGSRVIAEFHALAPRAGFQQTVLAKTTGHYYANSTDDRRGNPALVSRLMTSSLWSQGYFMVQYRLRN